MIELKIEDNIYEMPNSWTEVNVETYMEIMDIQKEKTSQMKKLASMISILSGCPLSILYKIDLEGLNKIDLKWISKDIEKTIDTKFIIDDKKYGMVKDMKKLSFGEYVDLDYYTVNATDNLPYIVSILMRPIIKEDGELYIIEDYNSDTIEYRAEIFKKKMNVVQLVSVSDFFLNSANGYIENMKTFLQ